MQCLVASCLKREMVDWLLRVLMCKVDLLVVVNRVFT